eukprot:CAMPEP_0185387286 /NCGR_PEP_ID=MMETSP1364-20130426/65867_1 /TAXON_ID=38817 /ORGANISM="Gephyrocapsa oceanica, Strain RCC1303" /LENGTH=80 /DNA_ID=CAMNT_0027989163 /DNA_START=46 /DNA_END=284 /DNA_ORIENTATION=-
MSISAFCSPRPEIFSLAFMHLRYPAIVAAARSLSTPSFALLAGVGGGTAGGGAGSSSARRMAAIALSGSSGLLTSTFFTA